MGTIQTCAGCNACVDALESGQAPGVTGTTTQVHPSPLQVYEYRHVVLPQEIAKRLPKGKLLSEVSVALGWRCIGKARPSCPTDPQQLLQAEWRAMGVQQSRGWVHYAIHRQVNFHMGTPVGTQCAFTATANCTMHYCYHPQSRAPHHAFPEAQGLRHCTAGCRSHGVAYIILLQTTAAWAASWPVSTYPMDKCAVPPVDSP